MKYIVHITGQASSADKLKSALLGSKRDTTVYVIGVLDEDALASILMGEDGLDMVAVAQRTKFIETIGKPDGVVTEAQLVALANKRITQLETQHANRS